MKQLFLLLGFLTALSLTFSFAQTNGNSTDANQVNTAACSSSFMSQFCPPGCCKPNTCCKKENSSKQTNEVVKTVETKQASNVTQASFIPAALCPPGCCSFAPTSCSSKVASKK